MIKHNKNTVTIGKEEWEDLLSELSSARVSYASLQLEKAFMTHFIRYYDLEEQYEAFKASPPEDDEDDLPFDSYRN